MTRPKKHGCFSRSIGYNSSTETAVRRRKAVDDGKHWHLAQRRRRVLEIGAAAGRCVGRRGCQTCQTSLRCNYERLSFGRCLELADAYTRGLREHGIERYDTALILMKSVQDLAPLFLALWKIGAVPLVLDGGGSRQQKLRLIEEAGPKALVGVPISHALRVCYRKEFGSVSHSVSTGRLRFGVPTLGSFVRRCLNGSPTSVPSTADDPMAVVFTSGSTGPPKGVVYTHGNGVAVSEAMKESLAVGPGDICLSGHPAFAMHFLGTGATVVVPGFDPRYPLKADPAAVIDVIRHQKPSIAFLQLSLLRNLWRHCAARGEKIPYLRKILTTGASVGLDLVEGLHSFLAEPDADLHIMYGATEALCISYATGRDLLARAAETRGGRGTYLGRPSSGVRVRIIGITPRPLERWSSGLTLPARQTGATDPGCGALRRQTSGCGRRNHREAAG